MNILFISSRFPYPPQKGDQLIVYQRIKGLSKFFDITLLTFYTHDKELEEVEYLKKYCKKVITVKLTTLKKGSNILKGIFSGNLPMQVSYFESENFRNEFQKLLINEKVDLVHVFTLRLAEYTKRINIPVIYELIDSMELNVENMVREEKPPIKWIYKIEHSRITAYEQNLCKSNKNLLVVSKHDKEKIGFDYIKVVPNGVDLELFKPDFTKSKKGCIVFSGNMGYLPNIHAVKWFVKYCFPLIREAIPYATFKIVGANPSSYIKSLHNNKSIIVTGYVESIVDELNTAEIAVAPMRSGSGMQNKILEAMACGLPVVTTHNGLEGLFAQPGKEVQVADTPETFAQAVISLLKIDYDYKDKSAKSRKYVEQFHSWESSNKKIVDIYLDMFANNKFARFKIH